MRDSRLATRVPGQRRRRTTIPRDATREDDLALHARDIAPLHQRRAKAPPQRIPVARVQQLEEGQHGEVRARDVDVEGVRELVHGHLVEQAPLELRDAQVRLEPRHGAEGARVGHHEVHVAGVGGHGVHGGLQRRLGADVADQRVQGRVRGCRGVEGLAAPAEDVHLLGAGAGEGLGHVQADAWSASSGVSSEEALRCVAVRAAGGEEGLLTGAAAGDDCDHAIDPEEL